ncbi:MAG: glycosyltransferase [Crocinitomicaceae bacterium]
MAKNQLSIIIPVFNEREKITVLIDFLLNHESYRLLEIIVVDAKKSTDNLDELKLNEKVKLISSSETCRAAQLQIGAEASKGDVLYFLHADTFPPSDYISRLYSCLLEKDFGMFSYHFDRKEWNFRFNAWMTQWKAFYTGGGDQGLFLSKGIFEQVGGFDTNLSVMEDYDLFWRLKKHKMKYQIVKSPATVSARKYEKNSGFKINMVNLITLLGFKWWGNNEKWAKFYKKHIQ